MSSDLPYLFPPCDWPVQNWTSDCWLSPPGQTSSCRQSLHQRCHRHGNVAGYQSAFKWKWRSQFQQPSRLILFTDLFSELLECYFYLHVAEPETEPTRRGCFCTIIAVHFDMKEAVICKFFFFSKPNYIKIILDSISCKQQLPNNFTDFTDESMTKKKNLSAVQC